MLCGNKKPNFSAMEHSLLNKKIFIGSHTIHHWMGHVWKQEHQHISSIYHKTPKSYELQVSSKTKTRPMTTETTSHNS